MHAIALVRLHFRSLLACIILAFAAACDAKSPRADSVATQGAVTTSPCPAGAMRVVEELGAVMRRVSLLAPDSILRDELTRAYSAIATDSLLDQWRKDPRQAPGRDVSSPWPARVEIRDTMMTNGVCRMTGDIVYVTNADTARVVDRHAVTLELTDARGWRVSAFTKAPNLARPPAESVDTTPAAVVRQYYEAIQARRYDEAFAMWSQGGQASGQTRETFAEGFAQTARVQVTVGDSVRMEGAAGSQYATVPVTVDATLRDGTNQRFTGTYTLRRSMVDGATPTQRSWHIASAKLSPAAR